MLEAADLGGEGGEAMTMTTIQEEMTTSMTSGSVRPAHITINLSNKEKGGLSDEEKGGSGYCGHESSMQVGDAVDEEKIWTTAMKKEKERVRARAMRRMAVTIGGAGAKTTTTEVAVEATAIAGGVDTGAPTTVTTATMVTAMTMTRLNVWDALTEEKERPSNPPRMHATIK